MSLSRKECFEIISVADREDVIRIGKTIEDRHTITVVRNDNVLLPIKAVDLKEVEFCLGDALATECKVTVDNSEGYMLVLGDDKEKAYYGAIIDGYFEIAGKKEWLFNELKKINQKTLERIATEMSVISNTKVEYEIVD